MSWPTFADGTVDWVLVFEDPDTGLIPLIQRADTSEKLISCVHLVVQSLFTRDDDGPIRKAYLNSLDALIQRHEEAHPEGGGDLTLLRTNISALLRTIKTDRIERARAFSEGRTAPPTTDEERRAEVDLALKELEAWLEQDAE
jgi:hypothetical protein